MKGKVLIEDFGEFVKRLDDSVQGRLRVTRVDGLMYSVEVLAAEQEAEVMSDE